MPLQYKYTKRSCNPLSFILKIYTTRISFPRWVASLNTTGVPAGLHHPVCVDRDGVGADYPVGFSARETYICPVSALLTMAVKKGAAEVVDVK